MKSIIYFVFALLLVSCYDEEEAPKDPVYFTLKVDHTFWTGSLDNWIIIHDKDGGLLEARHFERTGIIEFRSPEPQRNITITFLKVFSTGPDVNYDLSTYVTEEDNATWTLSIDWGSSFVGVGDFNLAISQDEINPVYNYPQLSDKIGFQAAYSLSGDNVTLALPLVSGAPDLLFVLPGANGAPRYKLFENAVPGNYSISSQDLTEYDTYTQINFEASSEVRMKMYEQEQRPDAHSGYIVNSFYNVGGASALSVTVGFLNWIPQYRTRLTVGYGNYSLGYEALGPAMVDDLQLNDDFAVGTINKPFDEFDIPGGDYDWYQASWYRYTNESYPYFHWSISGNRGEFRKIVLPEEIINKYPELENRQYAFEKVSLFKGTKSFNDYLGLKFKSQAEEPFELRDKTFIY